MHIRHGDRGRRHWVAQKTPAATNGASPSLAVGSKASANQRTLVHFALPAVPAGCKVTEAILRLNATSATNGRTLQAIALTAPWTEGAVTWNNQPSTIGAAATTASGSGWRQWTVTTQVNAMYTGANHGFLIRDASEGAGRAATQSFGSRESGARQRLSWSSLSGRTDETVPTTTSYRRS